MVHLFFSRLATQAVTLPGFNDVDRVAMLIGAAIYKPAIRQLVAEAPGIPMGLYAEHSTPQCNFLRMCTGSVAVDLQYGTNFPQDPRYVCVDGSMRLECKFGIRRTTMPAPRLLDLERMWLRDLLTATLVGRGRVALGNNEGRKGYTFELDPELTPECFLHTPRPVLESTMLRAEFVFGEFLLKHLSIDIRGMFMQGPPAAVPVVPPVNSDAEDEMADEECHVPDDDLDVAASMMNDDMAAVGVAEDMQDAREQLSAEVDELNVAVNGDPGDAAPAPALAPAPVPAAAAPVYESPWLQKFQQAVAQAATTDSMT